MSNEPNPPAGGSYIRKKDGSLERVEWTDAAGTASERQPAETPAVGNEAMGNRDRSRGGAGGKVKETGNG
jgi:hypothetical protein